MGTISDDLQELKLPLHADPSGIVCLLPRVGLLFLFVIAFFNADGRAGSLNKTVVTKFHPAIPHGPKKVGECWTNSIAVPRLDAWRCITDNQIYDPCFSSRGLKDAVICNANPADGSPGFVLELAKPLPSRSRPSGSRRPWLLKLADGSTCELQTGTIPLVAGLEVPYGCSDSSGCNHNGCPRMTGLTAKFQQDKLWMADKLTFRSSKRGLELINRKAVAVLAIWQ